jgi:hypothetical protein
MKVEESSGGKYASQKLLGIKEIDYESPSQRGQYDLFFVLWHCFRGRIL